MKSLTPIILVLFSATLFSSSCKKSKDPVMPPLTFTGENTFGCYINGELFVPQKEFHYLYSGGGASSDYEIVNMGDSNQYFSITINGFQPNEDRGIQIELNNSLIEPGKYKLLYDRYSHFLVEGQHGAYYEVGEAYYHTQINFTGECRILKFDTINRIVSGTFEFTGFNSEDSSSVEITEGRFDVTYND